MEQNKIAKAYSDLPSFLHRAFAHGSCGMHARLDALNMSFDFMSSARHDQLSSKRKLCAELLFFAFEVMPLNGDFAGQVLKAQKVLPEISTEVAAIPAIVAKLWQVPDSDFEICAMIKEENARALVPVIEKGVSESGHNPYWLRQALETAAITGDAAWLESIFKGGMRNLHPAEAALRCWCLGLACWLGARYEAALEYFRAAPLQWPGLEEMAGHCLARLGETEKALGIWRGVARKRPWHVSLLKTMHSRAMGLHRPLPSVPASTAVLLYSWNKAADLDATIAALAAAFAGSSAPGATARDAALIVCLDNGSTDNTGQVIAKWGDALGRDLFRSVRLPVNIGAAAARNWLADMPEVRACEYAAYLDDDAAVPHDWLRHLFRGVELYPESSSWGLRVCDARAPFIVQSGPLHLAPLFTPLPVKGASAGQRPAPLSAPPTGVEAPLPGQPATGEDAATAFSPYRAYGEPFAVRGSQGLGFDMADMGQFDFIGPCASTTGCCHLFKTAHLAQGNGFSLALSPSQYDDLEFDLRALRNGKLSCHNGFCSVAHFKRTGGGAQMKGPSFGNALGNKYKLHGMYSAEEITAMARAEAEALEADLARRLAELDE